jgi:hypothetical protein
MTADDWSAAIESEAKRICAEAPALHYKRSLLDALYIERDALWTELRELSDRGMEQNEAIERKMERARLNGDGFGMSSALQESADFMSSYAYRRVAEIPMVVDELNLSCIWPAEDRADPDPQAIEARRIKRERLQRKQLEMRLDAFRPHPIHIAPNN